MSGNATPSRLTRDIPVQQVEKVCLNLLLFVFSVRIQVDCKDSVNVCVFV